MSAGLRFALTQPSRWRGLSLLELMAALALLAVLGSFALPELPAWRDRLRLAAAQRELLDAVRQARELAMQQHHSMILCPSTDQRTCSDSLHWEHGWRIAAATTTASPLHSSRGYPAPLRILASQGRHQLRLLADGSAEGYNLSLVFCLAAPTPTQASALVVNRAGRSYLAAAAPERAQTCRAASTERE